MASNAAFLICVDVRDAFRRRGIALVGDDEPHRLAVRRDEHLHAALEVRVVEDLRRQVERVVVLRRVERLAHRGRVLLHGLHLVLLTLLALVHRQRDVLHVLHRLDHRRHQRDHLRHQRVQAFHVAASGSGCRRSSCRCRRGCRRSTGSTSRPGCRSSAVPSRSSCGSAGRSRRNWRCCPAIRSMSTVMSFIFSTMLCVVAGHLHR